MTLDEMRKLKPGDEVLCLFATITTQERRRCKVVAVHDEHVEVRLPGGSVVRKKYHTVLPLRKPQARCEGS